eukprot:m51a1_g10712 hypothetical protein (223) ;mRNA; r:190132-190800
MIYHTLQTPRRSSALFYLTASATAALLLLAGLVAGAGVVLDALRGTTRSARLEPPRALNETVDALLGPDDCLPLLLRADGLLSLRLRSSDLEFSVVHQRGPQCKNQVGAVDDGTEGLVAAVSLGQRLVLGSVGPVREGGYVVVRAVQQGGEGEGEGNATTRVAGEVVVRPLGAPLWTRPLELLAQYCLFAAGALVAACGLSLFALARMCSGDAERVPLLISS